jgi:phosphatidylglycerophosphate synthase
MRTIPSVRELQRICFHTPSDIYRRASIYFTRWALLIGTRANHITVLRALFLLFGIGVFFLAPITLPWVIIGLFAFQLVLFLDTMDGAIARYNKEASFFGEVLDFTLDHLSSTVIYFIVAGVLAFRLFYAPYLLGLSVVTVMLAQLAAFIRALYAEHRVNTEVFKQENVELAFFHQDNMRLLLLALTVGSLLHFYTTQAIPVLVVAYSQFLAIKVLFLLGFLWTTVRKFPVTGHLIKAYALSFFYVIFRTAGLRKSLQQHQETLVAKIALRF